MATRCGLCYAHHTWPLFFEGSMKKHNILKALQKLTSFKKHAIQKTLLLKGGQKRTLYGKKDQKTEKKTHISQIFITHFNQQKQKRHKKNTADKNKDQKH